MLATRVDIPGPWISNRLKHLHTLVIQLYTARMQVVAYNKIDVPDSGDYIDEVREFLLGEGVPPEDIFAISAATGQGVRDLVRRVRDVLDTLPVEVRSPRASFPCTLNVCVAWELQCVCAVQCTCAVHHL